ncbi:MAG TPA: DUF2723 domain-containing protein [Candidatus Eisenbacteria bacterium]|nr:DUF2723 domain-containing protein [Candidatus Eisenbacteria bacterium]
MSRHARGAAWVAALVALWVYASTLSPTVAWRNFGEDSGDLLVASATLGIPHPTGYPLYVLLGRVASLLPIGTTAFRINLVSALAGAAGVFFIARWAAQLAPAAGSSALAIAALLASLLYAFSQGAWSQSVVAEVYTLNILFLASILWALARAERSEKNRYLALAAYLFGLGLANHLLVLAAAPAIAWVAVRRLVSKSIGATGCVLLLVLVIWGVSLDAYLPIRASLGPEFSWGVPNTPQRLWWLLTGAQYRGNFFSRGAMAVGSHLFPGRWWMDFGPGLLVLAGGVVALLFLARRPRRDGMEAATAGASVVPALLSLAASLALLSAYTIPDDVGYWMPAGAILCGLAGAGWACAWDRAPYLGRAALGIASAALVILMARGNWPRVDASNDMTPYLYARRNLEAVEPNALIVSDYDGRTFSLWFYKATEFKQSHPKLAVVYKSLLIWDWYRYHIAKRYPGLVPPSGPQDPNLMLNRIVARNIKNRPVYLVRPDSALVSLFKIEPVGYPPMPIYRVHLVEP